jgi:hypothetical protein
VACNGITLAPDFVNTVQWLKCSKGEYTDSMVISQDYVISLRKENGLIKVTRLKRR